MQRCHVGLVATGKPSDPAAMAQLFAEELDTALAVSTPVLALVTGSPLVGVAWVLPVPVADVYQALGAAAVRVGVLPAGALLGVGEMCTLGEKLVHLTDMLTAPPWSTRSMAERFDFAVGLLLSAAKSEARTTGPGALQVVSEKGKVQVLGRGAVPKHFEEFVAPGLATRPYRALKGGHLIAAVCSHRLPRCVMMAADGALTIVCPCPVPSA